MGTNFYFRIKTNINLNSIDIPIGGKIKENILERLKWAIDEATEIHIGKRSCGWLPIFEQNEYYSSMKELKEFYLHNKENLLIVDEYNREYTLEQLDAEIFLWNKDNPEARSHIEYGSRYYYIDDEGYEFSKNNFI